jgi:hypothetical protein
MKTFKSLLVVFMVVASAISSLLIRRASQGKWRAGESRLQEQSHQLSALTRERERLSNPAAQAAPVRIDDNAAELAKLRAELAVLQKQTNDLGSRSETGQHSSLLQTSQSNAKSRSPEYGQQLRAMAGTKPWEARDLGRAFGDYAEDHQNQSPTSLDELAPYLAKNNSTLSGTNHYEIVYQGSLDDLKGLPWGSVAAIRDAQPWPGPDGTMMRVYGFPDGHSQMVSADHMPAFEAQHVISSPSNSSAQ